MLKPGEPRWPWPQRCLRAIAVGAVDTVVLVLVVLAASWAITEFGPRLVSRPGASAQVILPDVWPILRLVLPLYFVVKTLRALLKG